MKREVNPMNATRCGWIADWQSACFNHTRRAMRLLVVATLVLVGSAVSTKAFATCGANVSRGSNTRPATNTGSSGSGGTHTGTAGGGQRR
jgi:hypothetical protein